MQTESLDALKNLVCTLRPAEWLGGFIGACRVAEQCGFQFSHAAVDASPELSLGQYREPRLDLIQPGTRRRGEMQMIARMLGEPALHGRRLVRAVVVQDEMHVKIGRDFGVDRVEELAEF